MRRDGIKDYFIDYSGTDFTAGVSERELSLCLSVARDTFTDFEKLYYHTPFSEIYRRYGNLCAAQYKPLSPKELDALLH